MKVMTLNNNVGGFHEAWCKMDELWVGGLQFYDTNLHGFITIIDV